MSLFVLARLIPESAKPTRIAKTPFFVGINKWEFMSAIKTKKPYWEKLKDPRWQRKRLEVLDQSDFTCEKCESTEDTLHVHHKAYRKGAEPWEYANEELICLCDNCHIDEHEIDDQIDDLIGKFKRTQFNDKPFLIGLLKAITSEWTEDFNINSYKEAAGAACAFGALDDYGFFDHNSVIGSLDHGRIINKARFGWIFHEDKLRNCVIRRINNDIESFVEFHAFNKEISDFKYFPDDLKSEIINKAGAYLKELTENLSQYEGMD
jgi:hypothetical protein